MNAVELLMPDGTGAGMFRCGKCGEIHGQGRVNSGKWVDHFRMLAEKCCRPQDCHLCGKPMPVGFYLTHDECSRQRDNAFEAERFTKATKVTPSDYGGQVYHDGNLFGSVPGLIENMVAAGKPIPTYAWAAVPAMANEYEILSSLGEDHDIEFSEEASANLRDLLAAWVAKWAPDLRQADYSRAVVLEAQPS